MSATESELRAWLNDPASGPRVYGRDWRNFCQALVYNVCDRFGSAPLLYSSATAAYLDSRIESLDMRAAPRSAVHYWEYWATIGGKRLNYGHVGIDTRGGGVGLMSTGRGEQWANGAGLIDFGDWTTQMGGAVRYLGWSLANGQNRVVIVPEGSGAGEDGEEFDVITNDDVARIATATADQIWGREARDKRSLGQILLDIPKDVWGFVLGTPGSSTVAHGPAGEQLAQANARAGKAATRAQSLIDGQITTAAIAESVADLIAQAGGEGLSADEITAAVDEGFRRGISDLTVTVGVAKAGT